MQFHQAVRSFPSDTKSISNCHATTQDARLGVVDAEIPMLSCQPSQPLTYPGRLKVSKVQSQLKHPLNAGLVGWDIRLKFNGRGLIADKDPLDIDLLQAIHLLSCLRY